MPTYRITKPYTAKSRPMLFKAKMVQAILDGRKTQTRRVIKVDWSRCLDLEEPEDLQKAIDQCPYGKIGGFLYIKEGFVTFSHRYVENHDRKYPIHRHLPHYPDCITLFKIDDYELPNNINWSSPIFMRKNESRISLRIVKIGVERVQDMSRDDMIAEGIPLYTRASGVLSDNPPDPRWRFIELWDSINEKKGYGWDDNPWVWAIEFERIEDE